MARFKVNFYDDVMPSPGEINSGEQCTETAGYIPKNLQIRQMMLAGENLEAIRDELYDFKPGEDVPEDYIDPTRSPNFDWADADMLLRIVAEKSRRLAQYESMEKKDTKATDGEDTSDAGAEGTSKVEGTTEGGTAG